MFKTIVIALSLLTSGIVLAKDDNPEMAVCRTDFEKFCKIVEPGEGRQMACMYEKRDRLSSACATMIKEKYERFVALRKSKEGK